MVPWLMQKFIDQLALNSILFTNEPTIIVVRRLTNGIRSEKFVVVRKSWSALTQTLKPGIGLASLGMKVLSGIRL